MAQFVRKKAVFLPLLSAVQPAAPPQPGPLPPDDHTGCPCGWFDQDGRMLDYIR